MKKQAPHPDWDPISQPMCNRIVDSIVYHSFCLHKLFKKSNVLNFSLFCYLWSKDIGEKNGDLCPIPGSGDSYHPGDRTESVVGQKLDLDCTKEPGSATVLAIMAYKSI